jgi:predicted lipoprotein with Yx(FWY)xxD motif
MRFSSSLIVAGPAAVLALAACGGATPATGTTTGATTAPTAAAAATVMSATVSGHGAVLVAGTNKMTLYEFTKDVASSGTSACTGTCISTWPALTVPAGTTPTASGIGGQWGTITRSDGGGIQVTYNGKPLYFFSGDSKPGDANGNYPGWSSVAATAGPGSGTAPTSAPTPTPTAAGGGGGYGY